VNKLADGQLSFKVADSLWMTCPQQSIPKWRQINLCGKVGIVVMCDCLMKECQHVLEKRNKRKIDVGGK
jgi:hypothetical protein